MEELVRQLKALADPSRLRVAHLLSRGELTVSELVHILGQSQPRVSRHLKLLTDANLAERMPEGAFVFYRLTGQGAGKRLAALISEFVPDSDPSFRRDLERLEAVKAARAAEAQAYFDRASSDWETIRSLHLSEDEVEAAILAAAGQGPFDLIVDVGVGTGRMLEVFADRAARGVGVDVNHAMLNLARLNLEKAGIKHFFVREANVTALPFADRRADLVTVHQVLHYLDDPASAITECARVLKPGGILLIADFAPHQLEYLRSEHAHRRLGFSDAEMGDWVDAAGLDLTRRIALHPEEPAGRLTVKIWAATKSERAAEPGSRKNKQKQEENP